MAALYETDLNMKMEDVDRTSILAQADKLPLTAMMATQRESAAKRFTWTGLLNANPTVTAYPDAFKQTAFANQQPIPMYGFCQEFREGWGVGRQTEAAGTYTRHNDPVWQKKRALERLLRQGERAYSSRQEQVDQTAGSGAGTAPDAGSKLRGVLAALTPKGVTGDPQAVDVFHDDVRTLEAAYYAGALSGFDAEAMETILVAISEAQGEPVDLFGLLGLSLKTAMGKWIQRDLQASGTFPVSTVKNGDQFKYNAVVDFFKFEAGVVRTALTYHLAYNLGTGAATDYTARSGILVDKNGFDLRTHFPLEHVEIQDEGQGRSGFYRKMVGTQANMPRRCGMIYIDSDTTPEAPGD